MSRVHNKKLYLNEALRILHNSFKLIFRLKFKHLVSLLNYSTHFLCTLLVENLHNSKQLPSLTHKKREREKEKQTNDFSFLFSCSHSHPHPLAITIVSLFTVFLSLPLGWRWKWNLRKRKEFSMSHIRRDLWVKKGGKSKIS